MTVLSENPGFTAATKASNSIGLGRYGENLSIMIPNYNGAKYIAETLESLKIQGDSIRDAQIMVLDNGSTDASEEAIKSVWGDRVCFHRHEQNLGMIGNFNACIEKAERAWIHILHNDDILLKECYREFDLTIRDTPAARLVLARHVAIDEDGRWLALSGLLGSAERGELKYDPRLWCINPAQFVTTIFHRQAIRSTGGFDGNLLYCSDWDLWWRIAKSHPAAYTNQHTGLYRTHANNASSEFQRTGKNIEDMLAQINRLLACPLSKPMIEQFGEAYAFEPLYQAMVPQVYRSLGNDESFVPTMRAMSRFPKSLFSRSLQIKFQMIHLRHRLSLKSRLRKLPF